MPPKAKPKTKDSSTAATPAVPVEDSTKGAAQAAPEVGSTQESGAIELSAAQATPPAGEAAAAPTIEPVKAKKPKQRLLRIAAKVDGFRRCGRAWPADGVEVDPNDFSDDELARLKGEPELTVTEIGE